MSIWMKVYKLTVMVIDHDQLGGPGIVSELENVNFPNDCMSPKVVDWELRDIGEWGNDHPLNQREWYAHFKQLFSEKRDA